jgi:hypothetical protein
MVCGGPVVQPPAVIDPGVRAPGEMEGMPIEPRRPQSPTSPPVPPSGYFEYDEGWFDQG